jgi:hypothetical protein
MNIRDKFNYSNVASSVALVIAVSGMGGVAYAAGVAKNSVGSPQIILDLPASAATPSRARRSRPARSV